MLIYLIESRGLNWFSTLLLPASAPMRHATVFPIVVLVYIGHRGPRLFPWWRRYRGTNLRDLVSNTCPGA